MLLAHKFAEALQHKFNTDLDKSSAGFVYLVEVDSGKRFDKIVLSYTTQHDRERGREGSRSVHAFVERETGLLIKAAGWNAPAKIKSGLAAKYNLETDFDKALAAADAYAQAAASGVDLCGLHGTHQFQNTGKQSGHRHHGGGALGQHMV